MSDSEPHPDSADRSSRASRQESVDSTSSWEVISRNESTGSRPRNLTLSVSSPVSDYSFPDLSTSATEFDGLDSILESPVDVVIRRPTLPSKRNRRRLVSLLDTMSLHEYSLPLPDSPEKCVSTPDIHSENSGCSSPKIARVRPVKRGESMKIERPQSWTSRSLTSLTSLLRITPTVTSLENLGNKCPSGNFVFEFEG